MQRYFLKLSYKGTHFFGWQIQPNAISVQECIMSALLKINRNKPVKVTGCGRTDTGVHASEFFAHFEFDTDWEEEAFAYKLNCMLSEDIAIHWVKKVPSDLHSRFSATSRTYHYFIHSVKNPFLAETSWHSRQELDLVKMNEAAELLLTHVNFKCFSKTITGDSTFECNVTKAEWQRTTHGIQFTITANRFLRNMVRAIVGTLVEVGANKIDKQQFQEILNQENRNLAGTSVPAKGLFLVGVAYDNDKAII